MALNYTRLRATAERLIEENGRTVQLIRPDQGNPVDPTEPWRASTEAAEVTVSVIAVLVPFEADEVDGTLILRTDQQAFVAAKSVSDEGPAVVNVEDYDELLDDDGTRYRIIKVEPIKPGGQRILYVLQVRQ